MEDSFIMSGAMGFAYEAGLNERERNWLLLKKQQEDDTH